MASKNKIIKSEDKIIESEDKIIESEDKIIMGEDKIIMGEDKTREDEDRIREIVIKGYRDILKRDPDPGGLDNYIWEIINGSSIERFHDILRSSEEYKQMSSMDEIDIFNRMVENNKSSGKPWYYGLEGTWWWGMTEDEVRKEMIKVPDIETDKIVIISTWNIMCGIATYTKYLLDELDKISPGSFMVNPIIGNTLEHLVKGRLIHLQHEFGIARRIPKINPMSNPKMNDKVIITWHSVPSSINNTIREYESSLNVLAHIVHSEGARDYIHSSKDVYVINHGSALIPEIKKEDARKILGIDIDKPIGFVFGFQSLNKNYNELIDAAKNTDIHLIISGSTQFSGYTHNISNRDNVTFLNKHLTEEEVNLYALASDILLFDYIKQDHYSVSGAMHRIIGAGRSIVCSDIKHFSDIEHSKNCLKFKNRIELERCIEDALANTEQLGNAAKQYAEDTSWKKIAKRHLQIYKRYIGEI